MTTNTPSPLMFANRKAPAVPTAPVFRAAVVADVQPTTPVASGRAMPGHIDKVETSEHDGVLKAKQLRKGQRVRAFVHGKPQGGVRIVATVSKVDDNGMVDVTWASGHPDSSHKAAYRFFDESLVGTPVQRIVKVPALVPYQES